jgi:tetratricopeptide (TPR) repeat protein
MEVVLWLIVVGVFIVLLVMLAHTFSDSLAKQEANRAAHATLLTAVEALNRKDYDLAISCCNEALRRQAEHVECLRVRGLAHHHKKDYARALEDFTTFIQLCQSANGLGYRLRGDVHLQVGTLARALRRPGTDGDPLDHAIADYSDAIRLEPQDSLAHRQRARAYAAKGDTEQAVAGFTESLRLNSLDTEALCGRADVYAGMDRQDLAEADYRAALKLEPANERAAKGLAALVGPASVDLPARDFPADAIRSDRNGH